MIVLFLIGFLALIMVFGLACAAKAPVGYEDETGFHFGYRNVRENKIFGLLIIPVAKKSSDQPEDEKVIPLFPARIPWLARGIGIAAVFIGLLILLPERFQNAENPIESNENVQMEHGKRVATVIRAEPSRLMQDLCLRFSRAE